MTDPARRVAMDGGLRIVLPGTWARVPLTSEADARAFVKKLVRRQVGTNDRLARMRRQFTDEVVATAGEAARIGCHTYLMSLEILPGVPFPGAMLLADVDWPGAGEQMLAASGAEAAFEAVFPGCEVITGTAGVPIARRYELVKQRLVEGGDELLTLRLEYFLTYPYEGVDKLLMVRANVPDIPSAEPFAMLFDEIVDSIGFPERPEAATAGGEPWNE